MWKCKKCKRIYDNKGIGTSHMGYCDDCKEYGLLIRYDPLNPELTEVD